MDYLTSFFIGVIGGLLLNIFLNAYFSKKEKLNGELLATKEDIRKIAKEIEEIKYIYKDNYDISKAEKEFYDENGIE